MGSFGGFYKGEKKKPKKDQKKNTNVNTSGVYNPPTFSMPEVITKKKQGE